jgi:hypothetical protein
VSLTWRAVKRQTSMFEALENDALNGEEMRASTSR